MKSRWLAIALIFPGFALWAQSPQASAPIDITGYWVSLVTEDWRYRMLNAPKGDYYSIPLNAEGKRVADMWDPAKDEAAGEQCRSYGAPAIMQVPARFRVSWQDDNTLKVEADAGQQTRLFHFGNWNASASPATWQGDSLAGWLASGPERNPLIPPPGKAQFGSLKIVTRHIRPGYIRKNGVPYSANAEMTEYWNLNKQPDGTTWLVVTTMLHDPQYLLEDMITALHFRKEPDSSKWDPQPCSARW